jgi:hypothetical protein
MSPSLQTLALSKEPNRVSVSLHSPEDGNRSSLRNVVLSSLLEFLKMDKVHEPSESDTFPLSAKTFLPMKVH